MLNKYPLWKNLLVLVVLVLGFFYAAPNLYTPDPALQITGESSSQKVDEKTLQHALAALDEARIEHFGEVIDADGRTALVRLRNGQQQLVAQSTAARALGDGFIVALNLAPTTPKWLSEYGAKPMKLGLDLSGGVHFNLEVDVDAAVARRMEFYVNAAKRGLREKKIRGAVALNPQGNFEATFQSPEMRDQARAAIAEQSPGLVLERVDASDSWKLIGTISEKTRREIADYSVSQNLTTLRNRVNELGVSEPLVQRQGQNRIVVELPGIQDTAEAKRILGKVANLEFRLVANTDAASSDKQHFDYRSPDRGGSGEWLERDVIITGERVSNAQSSFDQNGRPNVQISLDSEGGQLMSRATRNNIHRRMGVLFIERKYRTRYDTGPDGAEVVVKVPYDEKKLLTAPTIQSALGAQFQITGLDNPLEASELALMLRAGALAAPISFAEERTVGPSLGAENIRKGLDAIYYSLVFVALFMMAYYRFFGFTAVVALTLNLILLVAAMSIIGATLTLPGIAGIVLTMGMSVDANVLIFARIREELRRGVSPQMAIHAGFERAFVTIQDSNLTALIIAIILYALGTGPIKGFAVTLSAGIIISMFTAITVTRAMINLVYGGRKVQKLSIGGRAA
jgi:preprotein translocase subunit SecD